MTNKENTLLHAVVSVELIKPLNKDWKEAGKLLRDVQQWAHRVLNNTVTQLALADKTRKNELSGWVLNTEPKMLDGHDLSTTVKKGKNAGKTAPTSLQTLSYQFVSDFCNQNKLNIGSSIKLAWANAAESAYSLFVKESYRGDRSLPTWNNTAPIQFTAPGWSIEKNNKGYSLSVKVIPGREEAITFIVAADGGSAHANIKKILDDPDCRGDLKLKWLPSKKKWIAKLAFSFEKPATRTGSLVVVHRGIRNFLTMADTEGRVQTVADGSDILHFKKQINARKDAMRSHVRESAPGAHGHGEKRLRNNYLSLGDKESNWVKTKCQQIAARTILLAQKKKASVVVIEDYGTPYNETDDRRLNKLVASWPFYQLKECIVWAGQKVGIEVVEVAGDYISQQCPKCGLVDKFQCDRAHFIFVCLECDTKRDLDTIACLNMLNRAGQEQSVMEAIQRGEALEESLKRKSS